MVDEIVLVIVLGVVKIRCVDKLGRDGVLEKFRGVELRDIGGGDFLLLVRGVEDGRAILCADVRSLAIVLCWIVRDTEENHQQLAVCDFRWIVDNASALGVAGRASADQVIVWVIDVAAAVSGSDFLNADDVFKDSLRAPKAAAREDGDLRGGFWCE